MQPPQSVRGQKDPKAALDDLQLLTEQFEKQRASKAKQKPRPVRCIPALACCGSTQ